MGELSEIAERGSRGDEATEVVALVVPCYNEAKRLDLTSFAQALASYRWLQLHFVDDGSQDDTAAILADFVESYPQRCVLHRLTANSGKAEAVRVGLNAAMLVAPICGFWDADLAAPFSELPQLRHVLVRNRQIEWAWGVRLRSLGRTIERREIRHYLGRVFATVSSQLTGVRAYDTQCGAKLFRSTPLLAAVIKSRFLSRWIFDVEMLVRLHEEAKSSARNSMSLVYEHPLGVWQHKGGSKVAPADFVRAFGELVALRRRYGYIDELRGE
jgi:dolichyl-phosphate beta-glucosyltransferase